MADLLHSILPKELNTKQKKQETLDKKKSEELSKRACEAKNRFENSLYELEELLLRKHQGKKINGMDR